MKYGIRTPSVRKRIGARTSWRRVVRHSTGLKAPRGYGWMTNPRRAGYNRIYSRATRGIGSGCALTVVWSVAATVCLVVAIRLAF